MLRGRRIGEKLPSDRGALYNPTVVAQNRCITQPWSPKTMDTKRPRKMTLPSLRSLSVLLLLLALFSMRSVSGGGREAEQTGSLVVLVTWGDADNTPANDVYIEAHGWVRAASAPWRADGFGGLDGNTHRHDCGAATASLPREPADEYYRGCPADADKRWPEFHSAADRPADARSSGIFVFRHD
jgi:hypothetical protein